MVILQCENLANLGMLPRHVPKLLSIRFEIKKDLKYGSMANYFTRKKLAAEPTQNKHE
jgi:hypothetical protein